jgi:hypothetical protein
MKMAGNFADLLGGVCRLFICGAASGRMALLLAQFDSRREEEDACRLNAAIF